MSKVVPRRFFKLVDEVQETMAENPDCDVLFMLRGQWSTDADGEVQVQAGAEAPLVAGAVTAEADVGFSRHWEFLGQGEFILRIERPGRLLSDDEQHGD